MITTVKPPDILHEKLMNKFKKKDISLNEFYIRCGLLYLEEDKFDKMVHDEIWKYGKLLETYKKSHK